MCRFAAQIETRSHTVKCRLQDAGQHIELEKYRQPFGATDPRGGEALMALK
jgi:hypothetical protein